MDIHDFCRRMLSRERKLAKIRRVDLDAVKIGSDRWEVYRGGSVGQFTGCCKAAAMCRYLDTIVRVEESA